MGLQFSRRPPILFNMKVCILVLALAVAAQAQTFEPAKCDWEKEMVCPGMWDPKTGEQTAPDTCMPMKNGDCWNTCPMDCGKDTLCPGKMDSMGCKMPDTCVPGKFCPAQCDWEKEMTCLGKWNEDWTEQIAPDTCMPMKTGDCWNTCPMDCGKDTVCPGAMDPKGCKMPDTCMPVGMECPKLLRDHLLFYMLKMMWIYNPKIL